ncbi:MAG: hypothetical protein IJ890_05480 [Clostridia bacterium]|nr:hypothetical protein [Clostridia bacterium]
MVDYTKNFSFTKEEKDNIIEKIKTLNYIEIVSDKDDFLIKGKNKKDFSYSLRIEKNKNGKYQLTLNMLLHNEDIFVTTTPKVIFNILKERFWNI